MRRPERISYRKLRFFFAVALTISLAVPVESQDLTVEDLERRGREAFEGGNYDEAAGQRPIGERWRMNRTVVLVSRSIPTLSRS
jgi:hypothetical protein